MTQAQNDYAENSFLTSKRQHFTPTSPSGALHEKDFNGAPGTMCLQLPERLYTPTFHPTALRLPTGSTLDLQNSETS